MTQVFDVDRLLATPRLSGLAASPDGSRLVTGVATLAPDGQKFRTALWEVDPNGARPARRLTRSAAGESVAAFLPDGALLFTSSRADPDAAPRADREEANSLWLLPGGAGEAALLAAPAGGVGAVAVARNRGTVAVHVPTFATAAGWDEDHHRGARRRELGVAARLWEDVPIRFWDHYLGPRHPRLATGQLGGETGSPRLELRDLTPDAGGALEETLFDITPDGTTVVTGWRWGPRWLQRLVAIDVATGGRRTLAEAEDLDIGHPACSPDGRRAAAVVVTVGAPDRPVRGFVRVLDLATGAATDLLRDTEIWAGQLTWTEDSSALLVSADHHGTRPVWLVSLDPGVPPAPIGCDTYEWVRALPGGRIAAVRSSLGRPQHPVILDPARPGHPGEALPGPVPEPDFPTRTEEMWVDAPDGRGRVQSWLHLPADADADHPVPLVLFIHGGPYASFGAWSWRWSPHVLTAHGYAVLMVNPALSTGYGWENVDRSWGKWGEVVEADLLAATDAACARPEIDSTRLAAAGGSFGGYMANWLAGHTDRFRCLVTHASVYALDQFHGTTDLGISVEEEFGSPYDGDEGWLRNSPRTALGAIARHRTPMLLIHGELDARVPVAESLRLFFDLRRMGVPARLLHFPDENHWILHPQNIRIWYETVLAFLDEQLRDIPFRRPDVL